MFNVLVFNTEANRNVTYKTVKSKKEAKNLVKELRKKGKKAQFVTNRDNIEIVENLYLGYDENEQDESQ